MLEQLQAGGSGVNPAVPQLMPGSPLSLTDPGSQLRAPADPQAPAPGGQPAPGATGAPATPAPSTTTAPQATPTPVPETEERGGGGLFGLFGGGS